MCYHALNIKHNPQLRKHLPGLVDGDQIHVAIHKAQRVQCSTRSSGDDVVMHGYQACCTVNAQNTQL